MADRITDYAVNSARWLSLEDFEGEIWENSIFENYSVSNLGRIKRKKHYSFAKRNGKSLMMLFKEKIIRQTKNKGYLGFTFTENGKKIYNSIHRLVAQAFIPNPNNHPLINHIDENKSNNDARNLEWCTEKYNSNYGNANIKRSIAISRKRKSLCNEIKQYYFNGILAHTYRGSNEVTNAGFCYSCVCKCCKHRIVSYKGYIWRYNNEPFSIDGDSSKKKTPRRIAQFDTQHNLVAIHDSLTKAGKMFNKTGAGRRNITQCCEGKTRIAYGYIWEFI